MDSRTLDYIFGPESEGATPAERARTSVQLYVRSQDQLSLDKPEATGRKLTAIEALEACGVDRLLEVIDYGSAVLPASHGEPAATLRRRRKALGLEVDKVARAAGLSIAQVRDCENEGTRSPIRDVQRLAVVLGLDERKITVEAGAQGDDQLAVRLRTLREVEKTLTPRAVATLAEAAWVVRTQARLQDALLLGTDLRRRFEPDSNYGGRSYPAWDHGYYLAQKTRDLLDLGSEQPIPSLMELCWELRTPFVKAELPTRIAGATIEADNVRGIVVNTLGSNQNVWVRRATIAHELGHLLWDPPSKLKKVRVDDYEEVESLARDRTDYVEARANAFAIAFLSPPNATTIVFRDRGLRAVMEHFGISYTAAGHHVQNISDEAVSPDSLKVRRTDPTEEWRAREAYTEDYFPLRETSLLRKGRFAGIVLAAEREGLISADTAGFYLQTSGEEYLRHRETIAEMFPV